MHLFNFKENIIGNFFNANMMLSSPEEMSERQKYCWGEYKCFQLNKKGVIGRYVFQKLNVRPKLFKTSKKLFTVP